MRKRARLACGVLLVAAAVAPLRSAPTPPGPSIEGPAREPLEIVLAAPPGAGTPPEAAEAMAVLLRAPQETAAALARRYPAATLAKLGPRDLAFERAVVLLDRLDHPAADDVLVVWFLELRRLRTQAGDVQAPRHDAIVLAHLQGIHDDRIAAQLLAALSAMDLTDRVTALRYLAGVAGGRPEIAVTLGKLHTDVQSPLREDRLLGAVLESLRGPP